MSNKTVAEKLQELVEKSPLYFNCSLYSLLKGNGNCTGLSCHDCLRETISKLADMIEAEQAELRKSINVTDQLHEVNREVDVDALLKLANIIEVDTTDRDGMYVEGSELARWANIIRSAVLDGFEAVLPEGIEWPSFEDGELVKFGDEFQGSCIADKVLEIRFCKTALSNSKGFFVLIIGENNDDVLLEAGEALKRPDTLESVAAEMLVDFDSNDSIEFGGYFERLRKLIGGDAR